MKYYLAHNGNDVFNYGKIDTDQTIETGQPILKFFDTIEELEAELLLYGVSLNMPENTEVIPDVQNEALPSTDQTS
jgi:hypothetical protein